MVALLATCYLLPMLWYFLLDGNLDFIFCFQTEGWQGIDHCQKLGFSWAGLYYRK